MCGGFSYQQADPVTGEIKSKKVNFHASLGSIPYLEGGQIHIA